jgi:hypothetical protein
LPLAYEGLDRWGVQPDEQERLLGIIQQRCLTGRNGAAWQVTTLERIEARDGLDRHDALRMMLARYVDYMHANEPVHSWPDT